jgi:transposase-like protein
MISQDTTGLGLKGEEYYARWFRRFRWPNGVVCPHCLKGQEWQGEIGFEGWSGFTRKYQCRQCQSYFNDRTGTLMSASSLDMSLWLRAIMLIGAGLPNQSLHHQLGVHPNTAQALGVRIRRGLLDQNSLIAHIHQELRQVQRNNSPIFCSEFTKLGV